MTALPTADSSEKKRLLEKVDFSLLCFRTFFKKIMRKCDFPLQSSVIRAIIQMSMRRSFVHRGINSAKKYDCFSAMIELILADFLCVNTKKAPPKRRLLYAAFCSVFFSLSQSAVFLFNPWRFRIAYSSASLSPTNISLCFARVIAV